MWWPKRYCSVLSSTTLLRIIYSFVDQYHSLCVDKEDILESQLEACENLLVATKNNEERQIIKKEKEILELCKYL